MKRRRRRIELKTVDSHPHQCKTCFARFATKEEHKKHVKKKHNGTETPYKTPDFWKDLPKVTPSMVGLKCVVCGKPSVYKKVRHCKECHSNYCKQNAKLHSN